MGLPVPQIEAARLPGKVVARVWMVTYPTPDMQAFGGPKLQVDLAKLKRATPREIREYAKHEMCHLRFDTKDHDGPFKYCLAVYEDRAEGR